MLRKRSYGAAIALATLIAGTLDILDAILFYAARGVSLLRILQSVAAGLLGRSAYTGGLRTAALGLLIHFGITLVWATLFIFAASRIAALSRHAVAMGLLYGALVFLLMNYVVLPQTRLAPVHHPTGVALGNAVAAIVLLIGLPIALVNRRLSPHLGYPHRPMAKLSIRDLDLAHKRVLIRVDFNVPLSTDGREILDDTRIRETIPTIEYALRHRAKVILCSHLGRPKGKPVATMSLRPVVDRLRELLDHVIGESENVAFSPDCVGEIATELATQLESGQTLLLENLRFHAEEEKNDAAFAQQLAKLCDLYVNDAFGSAHRAHASTEGITHFVRQSAAGLLLEKELTYLGKAVTDPIKPFVAIIGGAKVSDKIEVIDHLLDKADTVIIGGGMAYTFLNAQGQTTGKSLVEADKIEVARAALKKAEEKHVRFLLPVDHILADRFAADAKTETFSGSGAFPEDKMALDIGPESIKLFAEAIADASTVVWNGPMGVFEMPAFAHGTNAIAQAVAANENATTIVGGGDSVSAIQKAGVASEITHISTGGGASLEFLEGKILPGVAALSEK